MLKLQGKYVTLQLFFKLTKLHYDFLESNIYIMWKRLGKHEFPEGEIKEC